MLQSKGNDDQTAPMKYFRLPAFSLSLFLVSCLSLLLIGWTLATPGPVSASETTTSEIQYGVSAWQTPSVEKTQVEALNQESVSAANIATWQFWNLLGISSMAMVGPVGTAAQSANQGTAQGAVGAFGSLIAGMTSHPPIKTATYIADLGQSLGLATPAYAQDQGTGFKALEPVLPLWKAFRNIAYFGFVIIFVVVGFMIMFRAQINPQTVITIQAALPKIVVTLLLITFSYAIAALIIDLIYLLIYLLVGAFAAFGILDQVSGAETAKDVLLGQTIFGIAWEHLMGLGPEQAAGAAADAVGNITNSLFGSIKGNLVNLIGQPLAYVIFAVAILIAVFKLFFQLLLAYIGIIFSVIFAPITLLFNALPGNNGFANWLKGILANALIFPVTAVMLLVAAALLGSQKFGIQQGIGYGNPQYADADIHLPFVGGGMPTSALQALIAIGFLMMMPKIIEMVQKMMGIEGGFAGMAAGAMEPIAGAWGKVSWPARFGGRMAGGMARIGTSTAFEYGMRSFMASDTGRNVTGAIGSVFRGRGRGGGRSSSPPSSGATGPSASSSSLER